MPRGTRRAGTDRYLCPNGHVSILAAAADAFLDAVSIERLTRPDLIGLFRQDGGAAATAEREEAARYRRKIAEATGSYNRDKITLESLEEITTANRPKAEAAEKRARDLETPSALLGLPDPDSAVVAARWESLTLAARKAAFRVLAPDAMARPTRRGRPGPVDERVIPWPAR